MAQDAIDCAISQAGLRQAPPCFTASLKLVGSGGCSNGSLLPCVACWRLPELHLSADWQAACTMAALPLPAAGGCYPALITKVAPNCTIC